MLVCFWKQKHPIFITCGLCNDCMGLTLVEPLRSEHYEDQMKVAVVEMWPLCGGRGETWLLFFLGAAIGRLWEVLLSTMAKFSGHCRARKKKTWIPAYPWDRYMYSSSQILLALGKSCFALLMIFMYLADDFPNPLPIRQVRMKSYLPRKKIYFTRTMGQHFFWALHCRGVY